MNPVYSMYSLEFIVSVRCLCRPLPRFDAMYAAFLIIDQCISINPSLVGSTAIFGRMGVGKSARDPSTLLVAPAILSHTLVGIDGRFVTQ